MNVFSGWGDTGRDHLAVEVLYSTVAAPTTFLSLATLNYNPNTSPGQPVWAQANLTGITATGVAAIGFNFNLDTEAGYSGYRELDVLGTPTAPPPSGTTLGSGDIFSWTLNSDVNHDGIATDGVRGTDYTGLTTPSLSVASGAIFKVILGGSADVGTEFWNQTQTWNNIFDVSGTTTGASPGHLFDTFQVFSGANDITSGTTSTQGSFSMDGSSLVWTAVPEPSSSLAGLLLGAGLLRRRRA